MYFGDFIIRGLPFEDRNYQILNDYQKMANCLQDYLDEYNIMNPSSPLNMILFDQCIDHITRVCRILRQKNSHGLLIGVSGCGK